MLGTPSPTPGTLVRIAEKRHLFQDAPSSVLLKYVRESFRLGNAPDQGLEILAFLLLLLQPLVILAGDFTAAQVPLGRPAIR